MLKELWILKLFFKNKKNLGAGYSRNIGIRNSKGKFIAFIDADDIWNRNKLQNQLESMLDRMEEDIDNDKKLSKESFKELKRLVKNLIF